MDDGRRHIANVNVSSRSLKTNRDIANDSKQVAVMVCQSEGVSVSVRYKKLIRR